MNEDLLNRLIGQIFEKKGVSGNGDCFFYSIWWSAQEQGLPFALKYHSNKEKKEIEFNTTSDPKLNVDNFIRFMRGMLSENREYYELLLNSLEFFTAGGDLNNFLTLVEETLDAGHRKLLNLDMMISRVDNSEHELEVKFKTAYGVKETVLSKIVEYDRNVNDPDRKIVDSRVVQDDKKFTPEGLSEGYVERVMALVKEPQQLWATAPEVLAVQNFLTNQEHPYRLFVSKQEVVSEFFRHDKKTGSYKQIMELPPNSLYAFTDNTHYNAYYPKRKGRSKAADVAPSKKGKAVQSKIEDTAGDASLAMRLQEEEVAEFAKRQLQTLRNESAARKIQARGSPLPKRRTATRRRSPLLRNRATPSYVTSGLPTRVSTTKGRSPLRGMKKKKLSPSPASVYHSAVSANPSPKRDSTATTRRRLKEDEAIARKLEQEFRDESVARKLEQEFRDESAARRLQREEDDLAFAIELQHQENRRGRRRGGKTRRIKVQR